MPQKNTSIDTPEYVDDDHTTVKRLLTLRIPSLLVGLFLGLFLSFVTSRFDQVLEKNVAIAYFIPFIVYLSDAVGTQTQTIYIRDLKTGKANFKTYLVKESILGTILGVFFAGLTGLIIMVWFKSAELTAAVSLGVFGAVFSAPLIALTITKVLQLEHEDPAVWGGPLATVIQDTVSVVIFGLIASAILL